MKDMMYLKKENIREFENSNRNISEFENSPSFMLNQVITWPNEFEKIILFCADQEITWPNEQSKICKIV